MRRPLVVVVMGFVAGAALALAGAITEVGSVAAESSDPAQRARITTDVPVWARVARPLGLTIMAVSTIAGVLWLRRRR